MSPTNLHTLHALHKRQGLGDYGDLDDSCYDSWSANCGDNGVRYGVTAAIVLSVLLFLLLARHHAHRRIRAGLEPLAYHRWLARPQQRRDTYGVPTLYPNAGGWHRPGGAGHAPPVEVETGRHETDYTEMGAWNYAPPPPAYVPAEHGAGGAGSAHVGSGGQGGLPGYYAPLPGYVGDGGVKGGASAAVGQSANVGMSAEERERAQEQERELDMRRPARGVVEGQETGRSTAPVYR